MMRGLKSQRRADRFRLTSGVPQGTPTSPLLANFYLTPFDEHLEFEGVRAVRYVDDLVALAPTEHQDQARNALGAMRASLASLGLELNAHAEPIRSFDRGFEFLGFHLVGRSVRVAPSKLLEFRRHAMSVLQSPRAGSMRRRIALLNRMIRGWRAYYRAGVPRDQFRELDDWLEEQVRAARLAREQPEPRSLELAGLESLSVSGRRVFQPPGPPSVEGYAYRLPVEGEDDRRRVYAVRAGERLTAENGRCSVQSPGEPAVPLDNELRAVVVGDGAVCEATALRRLLDRGTALRFVACIAPDPPA